MLSGNSYIDCRPENELSLLGKLYSTSPITYLGASILALTFLVSWSTAATQYALVTRVTVDFEAGPPFSPFSTVGTVTRGSPAHAGSYSAICDVPSASDPAAYVMATFASYVPTMGVKFWVRAVTHGGDDNLSLAQIEFTNPSSVTLSLFRNRFGYFHAYIGSNNMTDTAVQMDTTKFYEVNVYYTANDDTARIYVAPAGGTAVLLGTKAFATAFRGGMSVKLGIVTVESYGQLAIDDFSLYASPMLNVSKPIVNPGEQITVRGLQFKGNSQVNITIRSTTGELIYSNPTIATGVDGSLSQTVTLPSSMAVGLYYVVAKQPAHYSGELIFHLGVWGVLPPGVNRTIPFNVTGYGAKPGGSVSLTIEKVPPPSVHILTASYTASSPSGRFVSSNVVLSASQPLGQYRVRMSATGTIDYASYSFEEEYLFYVSGAPLTVLVQSDARTYMRTQTARITAVAKYQNNTTVPQGSTFLLNVRVGAQVVVVNTPMTYAQALGMWVYDLALTRGSPTGLNEVIVTVTDASANTGTGTTNFTVTEAAIQAQFDFSETHQRSEILNISASLTYPSYLPVTQGTFRAVARCGSTSHIATMIYYPSEDRWKAMITIAPGDPLGNWVLVLSGDDVEGNSLNVSVPFVVVQAVMDIVTQVDLNMTYPRTTSLFFQVVVRYPSDLRMTLGAVNASLALMTGTQSYSSSLSFFPSAQAWRGYLRVPQDAPEGLYTVVVTASDPHGNVGNLTRIVNVIKATLTVDIEADRREFQVGFDMVQFSGSVYYPDGTKVETGSVSLEIAVGASRKVIDLEQSAGGLWIGTMQTGFFDSGGEYLVLVRADDGLGNTGSTTFSVTGSQLYVILSLGGVALSLAIALALIWRFRQSRSGPPSGIGTEYEYYL